MASLNIDLYKRLNVQPIQLQEICQQWQIVELALYRHFVAGNSNQYSRIINSN